MNVGEDRVAPAEDIRPPRISVVDGLLGDNWANERERAAALAQYRDNAESPHRADERPAATWRV